jgi:hypothetical protein
MKLAGKLHIWPGSADQTAEAWGTIRRSMKWREKPSRSSEAVEAAPVAQHADEAGGEEVGGAGEEAPGGAGELEAAAAVADREAHAGGLGGDAELAEQRFEVRVVAVVEDDEAGVDRLLARRVLDRDRVGVAADPRRRLVDGDVVVAVQVVGRHQARDSGSDDRDPHRSSTTIRKPDRMHRDEFAVLGAIRLKVRTHPGGRG